MCGIWAFIDQGSQIKEYQTLFHLSQNVSCRGPDKANVVMHPSFFLSFFRLAFHDLSPLGDQPFVFYGPEDTCTFVLCNGEIYNYKDLVERHGFSMRSDNDCEVIHHLFQKLGWEYPASVLKELDGEFAFVVLRVVQGVLSEVVVARDPFGVRPLFFSSDHSQWIFSSLVSGTRGVCTPFPPGCFLHISYSLGTEKVTWEPWYHFPGTIHKSLTSEMTFDLCRLFIDAVKKRTLGERPIACLLSGGLDSSLVCAVLVKILGWKNLHTFSIGMEGSTDLEYAASVASYLGTIHHNVLFTPEEGLAAIPQVLEACETWDITTIRASVGQFLLAKHISGTTPFRAILNGDGADEVEMGYLYWYKAPSPLEAHLESLRRLREIHLYDGLRVDRCLGRFGLEARVPYLDQQFVDFVLQVPIDLRVPTSGRMEKFLLREAFAKHFPGILPEEVLWRKKEAFSDGVSSQRKSWFEMIQEYMDHQISDGEFSEVYQGNFSEPPPTKEAYMYQKLFRERFGVEKQSVIPGYWLPKWSGDIREPSARVLPVYER